MDYSPPIHCENYATLGLECDSCRLEELSAPYIICTICKVNICTSCFASGAEFLDHKNNHDYTIFNDNFQLFKNSCWSAREELKLLNILTEYGNFDVVARNLPYKTLEDIKDHYDYFYLECEGTELFPKFSKRNLPLESENLIPYRFNLNDLHDPPRYTSNSFGFHSMAGYNAARSEFELEYDSNAEDLISNLKYKSVHKKDPIHNVVSNLQCAIINTYNRRLLERERRRTIIRNHGLILCRKVTGWLHRYDMTITRRVYERLCRFMQFYTGMQFEYILEGLHRAGELKIEISRLCEFHKKNISTLPAAELYMRLKQYHEYSLGNARNFQNNNQFNWKAKHSLATALLLPASAKKRSAFSPLNVIGLPGYEKLTLKEQEICKNVRLVPLSYIEFRDILINENRKVGYLKLQTARRLLKIDVNKTRRLYDFLVQEGYINKQ